MKTLLMIWLTLLPSLLGAQPFNSVQRTRLLNTVQIQNDGGGTPTVIQTEKSLPYTMGITWNLGKLKEIAFSFPLDSLQITSPFGVRTHPVKGEKLFHSGVDLRAYADTVRVILDGKVYRCGYDRNLGYFIRIRHGPCESLYGHLSMYFVRPEERVVAGQAIGVTGNTGSSTGEHLHFSVLQDGKLVDPLRFLAEILQFNNHHKQIKSIYGNTNFKAAMH